MAKTSSTKKAAPKKAAKSASKKVTKKSSTKTTKKTAVKKEAAAKKSTPKKAAAKKTAPKKTAQKATKSTSSKTLKKPLPTATEDKCFWTTDGQVLANLADLAAAFGSMDDTVFVYHANQEKNDFADWVEHVCEDTNCATDLRSCKKPRSARTAVVRHLKFYRV